jgi:thymidine kinase
MNSSKTANLIMTAHNYKSLNKKVILIKPSIDILSEQINSRAIGDIEVDIVLEPDVIINDIPNDISCILVDEAQFLSENNVDNLRKLSLKVPVICYGLRTDYRTKLFPGSKRLMELADSIEEIKTVCVECINRKAIINAKFSIVDNLKTIIYDGEDTPDLGREEKYQAMCWKCWNK